MQEIFRDELAAPRVRLTLAVDDEGRPRPIDVNGVAGGPTEGLDRAA